MRDFTDARPRPTLDHVGAPFAHGSEAAFYKDPEIAALYGRAAGYLEAGLAVNLRGPAGTGKTTLARRLAKDRDRPVVYATGDAALTSTDLLGHEGGEVVRQTRDRFVHSVLKTETERRVLWQEGPLATAMTTGATLIFDEFTRAPATAANALLAAIEEGVLVLPGRPVEEATVTAHEAFRVVLTSNPDDYTGTQTMPDALMDRLTTLSLPAPTQHFEAGVISAKTGLSPSVAERLVAIMRALRKTPTCRRDCSLRPALMLARVVACHKIAIDAADDRFVQAAADMSSQAGAVIDGTALADVAAIITRTLAQPLQSSPPKGEAA